MTRRHRITLLSKEDQAILGKIEEGSVSPKVWQHAEYPRNMGTLLNPDGQAEVTGICEDTIAFQLRLDKKRIGEIHFQAQGCGFTLACGSIVTELVNGLSIEEALGITGEKIARALGTLPAGHIHCADLAANALKATVRNALESPKEN